MNNRGIGLSELDLVKNYVLYLGTKIDIEGPRGNQPVSKLRLNDGSQTDGEPRLFRPQLGQWRGVQPPHRSLVRDRPPPLLVGGRESVVVTYSAERSGFARSLAEKPARAMARERARRSSSHAEAESGG